MSELVTIDLPEPVLVRPRASAHLTGRALEAVLAEWIELGARAAERLPDPSAGSGPTPSASAGYLVATPYGNEAAAQVLLDALGASQAPSDSAERGAD
jgi:hypothetical protein